MFQIFLKIPPREIAKSAPANHNYNKGFWTESTRTDTLEVEIDLN